jgi:hypothetical protein
MACLYRSRWVPKGVNANTHGYAVQTYVGGLPIASPTIPAELAAKLTPEERDYVEQRICAPARDAAARARQDAEQRQVDPVWRLAEARRLVDEAVEHSQLRRVPRDAVRPIAEALGRVGVVGESNHRPQGQQSDPLSGALGAIRAAANAVRDGALGSAPHTGARTTRVYSLWAQIVAEVDGTAEDSLLAALQQRGFVKRRRN